MSLAILFVIIEFKTPGTGIWAVLAALCGGAFFICQYYQELAGHVELIMLLIGVALIAVELFAFHTGGMLGIIGLLLCVSGIILAFMPDDLQFHPGTEGYGQALGNALSQSVIALGVLTAGLVLLIKALPNMKAVNRIAVTAEIGGTSAGTMESAQAALVGKRAQARSDLRPSGFVLLDGNEISATSEHGEYIAAGTTVEIVGMRYGETIVRVPV
jgi:membrane-bound serine protease (ClpP class)